MVFTRVPWRVAARKPYLHLLVLVGLALALISSPLLHGRLLASGEITVFYARYAFVAAQIRAGQAPWWNPFVVSGVPQFADPVGLFYPFTVPPFLLLPIREAINAGIVAHLMLAGGAMYLYLRSIGAARPGRLAGAVVYMLAAFTPTRIYAGDIQRLEVYAWIPLLFFLVEEIVAGRQRLGAALLGAACMGCQFLAGDPQTFVYSCCALMPYAGVRLRSAGRELTRQALFRRATLILVMFGFAALFSAIQALPTLELLRQSNRNAAGPAFGFLGSIPPVGLVSLVAPRFFGDEIHGAWGELFAPEFYVHASTLYVGFFTLALILTAWLSRRKRWPVRFFAWLAAAVLWVALGKFGYVYRLLRYLPLIGSFRDIENINILLPMSGAVLAAIGFERFLEQGRSPEFWVKVSRLIVLTVGAAGLLVGATFVRNPIALRQYVSGPIAQMTVWSGALVVIALLATLGLLRWRARVDTVPAGLTAGVVAFVVADLLYFGYPFASVGTDIDGMLRDNRVARFLAQDHSIYRVYGFGDLSPAFGVQEIGGEAALLLARVSEYTNFAQGYQIDSVIRPAGPHGILLSRGLDSQLIALLNVKYFVDRSSAGTAVFRNPRVLPRVLDSYGYRVTHDRNAILSALNAPDYDPRRFLILERDPLPPVRFRSEDTAPARHADLAIRAYTPTRIAIRAHFHHPGFLLLNDVFYPAWHAWIDGRETPIYRANYLFRAVAVPAGTRDVIFGYRDASAELGMLISGTAGLVAVAAWAIDRARQRLRQAGR